MFKRKFIFLLLFFLINNPAKSQRYGKNQIDSLLMINEQLLFSNYEKSLELSQNIYKKSKKIGYKKGEMYSKLYIGYIYEKFHEYKDSYLSTVAAEKLSRELEDEYVLANSLRIKARLYKYADFNAKDVDDLIEEGLLVSKKIKDPKRKNMTEAKLLILKAFLETDLEKSLKLHLKAKKDLEKLGKPYDFDYNYNNIADTYERMGKYDQADHYLKKSLRATTNNEILSVAYSTLASLELKKKNYKKSEEYINKSLDFILQRKKHFGFMRYYELAHCYKTLMDINIKTNDIGSYYKNQEILERYNDSLFIYRRKYSDYYIAQIKQYAKEEERQAERKKTYTITAIAIFFILLLITVFTFYKKEKKKLKVNELDINDKKEKLNELESKLNDAFKEVLEMAKNDDPAFLSRFKEVYPEFYAKLTSEYPELTISQLRFCCMLRLNFSTKDIAYYQHLSIKGVQVKKNRLRKILGISSEIDLNKWMMEY